MKRNSESWKENQKAKTENTACFFDNIELMNQTGETIYLQASVDSLFDYLKSAKKGRPLLAQKNDEELYIFRRK